MEKTERKQVKKFIKRTIAEIINKNVGIGAKYNESTDSWEVYLNTNYQIPEGFEKVVNGSYEDIEQPEIVAYMKENETNISKVLNERLGAIYNPKKEKDYNFTQPFPPMISTVMGIDGVPHLKTEEDKERIRKEYPSLVDMLEYDEKILSEGYFEFRGTEGVPEYEGFVLVKYADIRASYTFTIANEAVKQKMAV